MRKFLQVHFPFGTQIVRMFASFGDRRLPSDTQNFEARAVVCANDLENSCLKVAVIYTKQTLDSAALFPALFLFDYSQSF
jgi:hypothetical protein